jgi:hypothetical protein
MNAFLFIAAIAADPPQTRELGDSCGSIELSLLF